ncbi:hypothetical protein PR003_g16630 [Phytophthora rubi]|uniref:Uncharacterized protein n=1 Tax=Phytophthora rubi TaxID=129364 RepID=A0A6A4EXC5_9STRA|nr:hypothetical protein PR003_g16630 [Phytophthora rubi]
MLGDVEERVEKLWTLTHRERSVCPAWGLNPRAPEWNRALLHTAPGRRQSPAMKMSKLTVDASIRVVGPVLTPAVTSKGRFEESCCADRHLGSPHSPKRYTSCSRSSPSAVSVVPRLSSVVFQ